MQLNTQSRSCPSPAPQSEVAPEQADRLRRIVLGVTRLLNQVDRFESACCGVTVGQCLTLTTLRELGEVRSQELAQTLGLAPSTVTRAIAPLHRQGWIRRRRDPADRRQVWLGLTDDGAVLADQLAGRANATYGRILAHLPADNREPTLAALELLLEACRGAQDICGPPDAAEEPEAPRAPLETTHV